MSIVVLNHVSGRRLSGPDDDARRRRLVDSAVGDSGGVVASYDVTR